MHNNSVQTLLTHLNRDPYSESIDRKSRHQRYPTLHSRKGRLLGGYMSKTQKSVSRGVHNIAFSLSPDGFWPFDLEFGHDFTVIKYYRPSNTNDDLIRLLWVILEFVTLVCTLYN
jgi:hypothetical protein